MLLASSGVASESWAAKLRQRQESALQKHCPQIASAFTRVPWRRAEPGLLPPVGATYVGTMRMPVIGRQTFLLRILSRSRAQITLVGWLNLDQTAGYRVRSRDEHVDPGTVTHLIMEFNEPTLALLRAWRTTIRATHYHPDGEYTVLVIKAPVIPPLRVKLHRSEGLDPLRGAKAHHADELSR